MWTSYTRETPAKPGWTIATMAVALAATIAVAQWQVTSHTPGHWKEAFRHQEPGWPITFALPDAVDQWRFSAVVADKASDLLRRLFGPSQEGAATESIAFHGYQRQHPTTLLVIGYGLGKHPIDVDLLRRDFNLGDPNSSEPLEAGGTSGRIETYIEARNGLPSALFYGHDASDTPIFIFVNSANSSQFTVAVTQWICESIRRAE